MEAIQVELINLVITMITVFAGVLTTYATKYLKKKGILAQVQNNKEVAKIVVGAVEQMYKHLNGDEKLNLAKMELVKLAQQKKVKMSEKDIDLMIEAMVKEMKQSYKKEVK